MKLTTRKGWRRYVVWAGEGSRHEVHRAHRAASRRRPFNDGPNWFPSVNTDTTKGHPRNCFRLRYSSRCCKVAV